MPRTLGPAVAVLLLFFAAAAAPVLLLLLASSIDQRRKPAGLEKGTAGGVLEGLRVLEACGVGMWWACGSGQRWAWGVYSFKERIVTDAPSMPRRRIGNSLRRLSRRSIQGAPKYEGPELEQWPRPRFWSSVRGVPHVSEAVRGRTMPPVWTSGALAWHG